MHDERRVKFIIRNAVAMAFAVIQRFAMIRKNNNNCLVKYFFIFQECNNLTNCSISKFHIVIIKCMFLSDRFCAARSIAMDVHVMKKHKEWLVISCKP